MAQPDEQSDPLQLLLEVQSRDLALDQLAYRRRELDERAALGSIDEQISKLSAERKGLDEQRELLSRRQAEIESHVSSFTERIATIEARLRQGGAFREMQSMSSEVESLGRHRRELEDRELAVMEELEPVEKELSSIDGELSSLDPARESALSALSLAETALDEELASVRRERSELAEGLPDQLSATYESLRQRLGGIGAAKLADGRCSGCHLQLPSSERDRLVHSPPGTLEYCDQCGRILVP